MSNFSIIAREGSARAGILKTAHGEILTPAFGADATQNTVKSLDSIDTENSGSQFLLVNTYHNLLDADETRSHRGVHKLMHWNRPIFTDSGGFQAFSLGIMIAENVRKVNSGNIPNTSKPKREPSILSYNFEENGAKFISKETDQEIIIPKDFLLEFHQTYNDYPKRVSLASLIEDYMNNRNPKIEQIKPKIFSKVTEDGVEFKMHSNGQTILLTPEMSMDVQFNKLGTDVGFAFDDLLSNNATPEQVKASLERTHRWETRSLEYFKANIKNSLNPGGQFFGILQGVSDEAIRVGEAKWASSMDFDGICIGGSFGEGEHFGTEMNAKPDWAGTNAIYVTMKWVTPHLPEDWAKHALGIGEIVDLFNCVEVGIDLFDCVAPTKKARHGALFLTPENGGNLKNKFSMSIQTSKNRGLMEPIDRNCECYTCQYYTKGYLNWLERKNETSFFRLATLHNLHFVNKLMNDMRIAIIDGQFDKLKQKWLG